MKKVIQSMLGKMLLAVAILITINSCNKELPNATPLLYPKNGDTTMFGLLTRDTSLSFYRAAVVKAGLTNLYNDNTTIFTAFVPNNNAFIASGITSIGIINVLPVATVTAIVNYSIIPGEQFVDSLSSVSTNFPNVQLPSYLTISSIPGTALPINMPIFPSKRPSGFWVNNIPVISSNKRVQNGIVHIVGAIVNPPSNTLSGLITSDPNLTIFNAAIARADSGQQAGTLSQLAYVLAYPVANLTVFAPTNAAFKAYINAASGGLIPLAAPDAFFIAFINNPAYVSAQTARGLVVYHLMPYRAFSVNFPTTPQTTPPFFPTLLNQAIPTHPGLRVQSTLFNGFGVSLMVTGIGNGNNPAISNAPANLDKNAINGVEHIIDRVLLPQ